MNIYLEIFGYIGTALVILSMTMTSLKSLRLFNICGSVISAIYSVIVNAWPIVIMNAALVFINIFQLWRKSRLNKSYAHLVLSADDKTVEYFLTLHKEEIEKDFPGFDRLATDGREVHMLYIGNKVVGMLIGVRTCDLFTVDAYYVVPEHRASLDKNAFYPELSALGVKRIVMNVQNENTKVQFEKLGFVVSTDSVYREI